MAYRDRSIIFLVTILFFLAIHRSFNPYQICTHQGVDTASNMTQPSFNVTIVKGAASSESTDQFELLYARRSLALMKSLLGYQGLLDLLQPCVAESNKYWEDRCAQAAGAFQLAGVEMSVQGLSVQDFLDWFHHACDQPQKMQAAHPEHYITCNKKDDGGRYCFIENLGPWVSYMELVDLQVNGPSSEFVKRDPAFPLYMTGKGYTSSGKWAIEVCHQFKNNANGSGFDVKLGIWFPASCEEELIEAHRQHFLVEFSNWLKAAAKDLRTENVHTSNRKKH